MTNQSWLDDEPRVWTALGQLADLWRAGLRQRWLTLTGAILLAAGVAFASVSSKGTYAPRFVLRVVETDRDTTTGLRMKRELAEYVRQAIFTSGALLDVIRRHHLYGKLMRVNSRAALDSFREDIAVEVYQNYFIEDRAPEDFPRSARLAVSYRSKDQALALAVTRDLGALIIEHERAAWREQARDAAISAELARDAAKQALEQRTEQALLKQSQIEQAKQPDPRLQVELIGLLGSIGALERRAQAAERDSNAFSLTAASERHGVGFNFEVVDDGSVPSDREHRRMSIALGLASFTFGLPLLTAAIGAFYLNPGKA
jgi:hypothetical protein